MQNVDGWSVPGCATCQALKRCIISEMRRDDGQITERCGTDGFERNTRHSPNTRITGIRQQMPVDLLHRIARQNHVAEMAAPAVLCRLIDCDAWDGRIPWQKRREQRKLVFARAAAEIGVGKIV